MKKSFVLLLLLIVSPLLSCRQPNPAVLRTEPLTAEGTVIQAAADQPFEVVLQGLGANPSYKWVLQPGYDTALLRFEREREATSEYPSNPPPGYAPNRVFEFTALKLGDTRLRFTQEPAREGIPAVSTERIFEIKIQASLEPSPSPMP